MTDQLRHPVPNELGNPGRKLWTEIVGDMPPDIEFDARELATLRTACRQADLIVQLETALKKDGVMIAGAKGQRRLNAAVTELRQCRIALVRILGDLGMPDEVTQIPETALARRNRRAANARWGKGSGALDGQGALGPHA
jgi:phage terminase small subunit